MIDFGPFVEGDVSAQRSVAEQMRQASRDWGFFYLENCGMPAERLAEE